ncbi:MAG: hypothetical protein KGZ81_06695 [Flavobacteriales bacterium]|nr:hypothetical protein [Flavobacteriales bacterium]
MTIPTQFTEKQYFRQWWIWTILLGILGFLMYELTTEDAWNLKATWLVILPMVLFFSWFFSLHLQTKIDEKGIYATFHMLFYKYQKVFSWEDVQEVSIVKYHPVLDCGGWGIKWYKNGLALNVSGNIGLEVVLHNQKKYLIGTQKSKELKDFFANEFFKSKFVDKNGNQINQSTNEENK